MQDNSRSPQQSGSLMELDQSLSDRSPTRWQDIAACTWLFSGVFWMLVTMSFGMIEAIKLIYPHFLGGVSQVTFGRLRPVHVNGVLFGWLSMAIIGGYLYMIPRLSGRKLYYERVCIATAWFYNLIVASSIVLLAYGFTKGKEYEEWIRPLNLGVILCVDIVAACLLLTLLNRRHERLYVTVWYGILAFVGFNIVYASGNFPIYWGAEDASVNWFYAQNFLGLWLVGSGVAMLYYTIPKQLNQKIFSHQLALWSFWLFAAFCVWTGGRHLIFSPVPEIVPMTGLIFALAMTLPVAGIFVTWIGTYWGNWGQLWQNVPLRFSLVAAICFLLYSYEGSVAAIQAVWSNQQFTDFSIAHVHLGFAGFATPAAIALIYWIVEHGLKRPMSSFLKEAHFWTLVLGLVMYVVAIQIAGYWEGQMWASNTDFGKSVELRSPYYWVRAFSGIPLIGGQFLFAFNIIWAFQSPVSDRVESVEDAPLPTGTEAESMGRISNETS